MEYGSLNCEPDEVHDRWYPKSNKFTETNKNTLYKNTGLNTVKDRNRVHDILDVYI